MRNEQISPKNESSVEKNTYNQQKLQKFLENRQYSPMFKLQTENELTNICDKQNNQK